eukprot:982858-Prorocentrum_minimum.AAC.1
MAAAAAAALAEANAAAAHPHPLADDHKQLLGPATVAAYPAAAARVEAAMAGAALRKALKALTLVLSTAPVGQQHLIDSGAYLLSY